MELDSNSSSLRKWDFFWGSFLLGRSFDWRSMANYRFVKILMKSAPLGLAGCQEWSLATEALPVDGVVCLQSKHLRSFAGKLRFAGIDRTTGEDLHARSIVCRKCFMKHFRQTDHACLFDRLHRCVYWHAPCSRRSIGHCSRRSTIWSWPVTTMHDRARTGRERRPWWLPSEASYLTVWTLNDRFFAFLVFCMVRRVLSEYWRKETENRTFFGGVVGLDGRCSAQAEQSKKPVAVVHLPGAYLSTETNLVPIRGVMRKEFDTGQTHTHTHTHTHTQN